MSLLAGIMSNSRRNSIAKSLSIDMDPFESLEDLLSVDSHGVVGSPTVSSTSSIPAPGTWYPSNAVHMEIQENAKLATFNLPVDRSNSSSRKSPGMLPKCSPATNRELEMMMQLTENDINLTELFLKNNERSSKNMNYSFAGALMGSIGDRMKEQETTSTKAMGGDLTNTSAQVNEDAQGKPDSSVLTSSTARYPLPQDLLQALQPSSTVQQPSSFVMPPPTTSATSTSTMNSYYPYGRLNQLPIPRKVPSPEVAPIKTPTAPPSGCPMQAALHTAAFLASHGHSTPESSTGVAATKQDSSTVNHGPSPFPSTSPTASASHQTSSVLTSQQSTTGVAPNGKTPPVPAKPTTAIPPPRKNGTVAAPTASPPAVPSPSHCQRQRASSTQMPAARPNSLPAASIVEATKLRSQFGFGGNHVVPSVPNPPPRPVPRMVAMPNGMKQLPPVPMLSNSVKSMAAYERKKQKAKDARVKLNEAIEKLSVAMCLAGSQTQQRLKQMQALPLSESSLLKDSRRHMMKNMRDCVRIADDAKKFDRPTFVGSAATVIQVLNAQCEGIMRELMEWKQIAESHAHAPSRGVMVEGVNAPLVQSPAAVSPSIHTSETSAARSSVDQPGDDGGRIKAKRAGPSSFEVMLVPAKRQRVDSHGSDRSGLEARHVLPDEVVSMQSVVSQSSVMKKVASFLDVRSLLRCLAVSKTWKDTGVFQCDQIWSDDAVRRFGSLHVQDWKAMTLNNEVLATSPIKLYKAMDAANVKPYCTHEGSLLLGEARMPGRVSAWVSLVERSNGETLRSVRNEMARNGTSQYSSLPVVELRILVQNTGMADSPVVLREQTLAVDASTRRRREEMKEIQWDFRLKQAVLNIDGTPPRPREKAGGAHDVVGEWCRLGLYESVILVAHIHARGCSTISKFKRKANFTKVLFTLNGTTIPLVIPFYRESTSDQGEEA